MGWLIVGAFFLTAGSAALFYINWPLQSCTNMISRGGAWALALGAAALWIWIVGWHVGVGSLLYWTAVVSFVVAIVTWLPALEGVPSWFPKWANEELVIEICLVSTLIAAVAFIVHSTLLHFGLV